MWTPSTVGSLSLTKNPTFQVPKNLPMMIHRVKSQNKLPGCCLRFQFPAKLASYSRNGWLEVVGVARKIVQLSRYIAKRCFKFLKFCCEDEEELSFEVLDFSLCSHSLLFKFIDYLQDECKLGHGGRLGYIDVISELIDFRNNNNNNKNFI